jgi:hypothetical protein
MMMKYVKGGMRATLELSATLAGISLLSSQMMMSAAMSVARFLGPIGFTFSMLGIATLSCFKVAKVTLD